MAIALEDICNIALSRIGASTIRNLSESDKRSRLCAVLLPPTVNTVLTEINWNFAKRYATLQAVASTEPVPTGKYGFVLPSDCLKVRQLLPDGFEDSWALMADSNLKSILVCEIQTAEIYYTSSEVPVQRYSSAFIDYIALCLASVLVMPLTRDRDLLKTIEREKNIMRAQAEYREVSEGNEGVPKDKQPYRDSFVNADKYGYDELDSYDPRLPTT